MNKLFMLFYFIFIYLTGVGWRPPPLGIRLMAQLMIFMCRPPELEVVLSHDFESAVCLLWVLWTLNRYPLCSCRAGQLDSCHDTIPFVVLLPLRFEGWVVSFAVGHSMLSLQHSNINARSTLTINYYYFNLTWVQPAPSSTDNALDYYVVISWMF